MNSLQRTLASGLSCIQLHRYDGKEFCSLSVWTQSGTRAGEITCKLSSGALLPGTSCLHPLGIEMPLSSPCALQQTSLASQTARLQSAQACGRQTLGKRQGQAQGELRQQSGELTIAPGRLHIWLQSFSTNHPTTQFSCAVIFKTETQCKSRAAAPAGTSESAMDKMSRDSERGPLQSRVLGLRVDSRERAFTGV